MKQRRMASIMMGAAVMLAAGMGWAAEHGGNTPAPEAKEHGGQEHGGQEHGGLPAAPAAQAGQAVSSSEPTDEAIRQAVRDHIDKVAREQGAFTIKDLVTKSARTLTLVGVHDRIGKTGKLFYSCTDMRDTGSGELLDLDFDVKAKGNQLTVVDARIHKVDGQARYTYDDKDNRIPVED